METCSWDAQLWLCLYAEAKQWQAGIAALIGFLGLIGAALYNFRLNRRRDAQLRGEEMVSVGAALYGEILLLRKELELLASAVESYEKQVVKASPEADLLVHTPSKPLIYPALAHKLGVLPSELVLGVTKFYDHVEGARIVLKKYIHMQIPASIVLKVAVGGIEDAKPVLRRIEHLASIPEAKDPWE